MSATASLTLVFDSNNRLAVTAGADGLKPADASAFAGLTEPREFFTLPHAGREFRVHFAQAAANPEPAHVEFRPLEQLAATPAALSPLLAALLPALEPHLIHIPYLELGENDFIYKFRPEKDRNLSLYSGRNL